MEETHTNVMKDLENSQSAENDNREAAREADLFLNKRDGQWEPYIWNSWEERPRYTFDKCNPIVDGIMGEMETMDFAIAITPTGGGSTKDSANNYSGIIRNLENISKGRHTYNSAGRVMVGTGLAGWRVVQKYRDSDSFQQDLMIQKISNFKDRVWFDVDAVEQDMSDSDKGWVLTSMSLSKYLEKWPKGSKLSVGQNRNSEAYYDKKPDEVVVGEYYFKKYSKRTLVLMSDYSVYVADDDFNSVRDELAAKNVTVIDERERSVATVYHRHFDGGDYLNEGSKTVFEYVPLIPVYANFGVSEDKIIYWSAVEKLMDPQRVLNYSESKKVADSALKPVEKTWATKDQVKSPDVLATIQSQNTNTDPVQIYDHAQGQAPPYKPQSPQPDGVLIETAASAKGHLQDASGLNGPGRGIGLANQSDRTVEMLQNKSDSGDFKYYTSMEIAIAHTACILVKAIPKVYNTRQEMQLMGEDGTFDTITIKEQVFDEDEGKMVEINDLSVGSYGVTCSAGPAFKNKQQEMNRNLLEAGKINPRIIELSSDILVNNMHGQGMEQVGERLRMNMISQGLIPESQWTDEEKEQIAAMQEKNQTGPSPIEQAQLGLAQAELEKARAVTADTLSKVDERQAKAQHNMQGLILKNKQMIAGMLADQEDRAMKREKAHVELILSASEQLKTQVETLKSLKETMGADAIMGPKMVETFSNQVEIVGDNQDNQRG